MQNSVHEPRTPPDTLVPCRPSSTINVQSLRIGSAQRELSVTIFRTTNRLRRMTPPRRWLCVTLCLAMMGSGVSQRTARKGLADELIQDRGTKRARAEDTRDLRQNSIVPAKRLHAQTNEKHPSQQSPPHITASTRHKSTSSSTSQATPRIFFNHGI